MQHPWWDEGADGDVGTGFSLLKGKVGAATQKALQSFLWLLKTEHAGHSSAMTLTNPAPVRLWRLPKQEAMQSSGCQPGATVGETASVQAAWQRQNHTVWLALY